MARQQSFNYDNLGKGINSFTRDTMITEKETADASNVWSVGKNSLAKRPGYRLACEVAGVDQIDGMGSYYTASATELLIMAGGKLYKNVSGVATQIDTDTWTSGERADFCQAGGKMFISNGTNNLREYNGSTITDTTNGKVGRFAIFYKGSLFIAGDPSYPTRLYRSGSGDKLGDFTYNETDNPLATSIFVGKDDGQSITGLFKHQDYLYIAKERSIYRVGQSTDEAGTLSLELVDPGRGVQSHWTIDTVENDIFFFDDVGVFAFGYEPNILDQIRTNIVSLRVDPKIKAIQKSRLSEVAGFFYDNHYYLSYTSGGGGSNDKTLVYDRQRLSWWEFNIGANCYTEFKDSGGYSYLYFGSSTNGKVYYYDETAKNDDGEVIESFWKSPKYSFKDYVQQKYFHFVILYFGNSRNTLTVKLYVDGKLHKTESIRLGGTSTGGIGTQIIGQDQIGVSGGSGSEQTSEKHAISINKIGSNFSLIISDEGDNKTWELNAIEGVISPLTKLYVKTN